VRLELLEQRRRLEQHRQVRLELLEQPKAIRTAALLRLEQHRQVRLELQKSRISVRFFCVPSPYKSLVIL
jgi:hypothetical protein